MHWAHGRRLGDVLADLANSFGGLRLAMALAVVFSHSAYLTTHQTAAEPLYAATGFTLGQHAVHVFFILSGLLVTASLVRAETLTDFFAARALRILPGLIVCALATAFVLGPALSSLPLASYLASSEPYLYVVKTAALVTGSASLPGVFSTNPVSGEINIPVWTLKYEVLCYAALGAMALAGVFRSWNATAFVLSAAAVASVLAFTAGTGGDASEAHASLASLGRLSLCFTVGVTGFVLKDRLTAGPLPVAVAGLAYALARGTPLELLALVVLTAALAFAIGGVASGPLADVVRVTDLSYGTYIYGWPVMQLLLALDPSLGRTALFFLTVIGLVPIAYLSWRFVERPALAFKRRRAVPQLGTIGRRIAEARAPIGPVEIARLDVDGEAMPPPPSRQRINRALRVTTRQTMRVIGS